MNLIVPVNVQALRVTPNDASLLTKQTDHFSGPTTSFEELPWRDANYTEHAGRLSRANISANIVNPLSGGVVEQLDAGIHLHWALPDGLTRGSQQPDGSLLFPAVPNRWLVTRIIQRAGGQPQAKQWIVESDYLMTEDEYVNQYYPATHQKSVAIPVGWTLIAGNDPTTSGGALYYPPSRRMGRVFDLDAWRPVASPPHTPVDQIHHFDEIERQANAFVAQGKPSGPLTAVGASGPAFAAYYPDSRSSFGFHDRFDDLGGGFNLGSAAFLVSYQLVGWHSHASDDPLQSSAFADALAKAATANRAAPPARQVDVTHLQANVVLDLYRWSYDPAKGTPSRCLYGGQVIGLPWDTTGNRPTSDPSYPKCYLLPLDDDPTVRVSVGSSISSAMSALIKHEWTETASASVSQSAGAAANISDQIEQDLECLLDALQLGLLHKIGVSTTLPELEQSLHQSSFGSHQSGRLWAIRQISTEADKADPERFNPPDMVLPTDSNDLAGKLGTLNACQARLDALLHTIESCQQQIFLDWYHYVAAVGSDQVDDDTNKLMEDLKRYISEQILDLWAKLDAAFGIQTAPSAATGNVPVFYSDAGTYLAQRDGRYVSTSPAPSLAGQIVAAANGLLDVLALPDYATFELQRTEGARYWEPQELVVVATGDGLRPALRNGQAKYLPCRLSTQLLGELKATSAGKQASATASDALTTLSLKTPDLSASLTPEAGDTRPLFEDVGALLGEACLLDFTLAPTQASKLTAVADASLAANLQSAVQQVAQHIAQTWQAGAPEDAVLSIPAIVTDQRVTAGTLQIDLPGQAPQGVGLTFQIGDQWQDPFLPLFLLWEVGYEAFEKGAAGASSYDQKFVTGHFQLDENTIDLTLNEQAPPTQGGTATLGGSIPLSSRAAEPLLDQVRQYLADNPTDNQRLAGLIQYLRDKPLLSQGLSGIHPAMLSRARGLQLAPFDPFYDSEAPATGLGAGSDTLNYANVLTHFVGWAVSALTDQVPLGTVGYNPLRSGYVSVARAQVVDVFGRKRRVLDPSDPDAGRKVIVSSQMLPPADVTAQINLPPRLAQPARLQFEWISANDEKIVTNAHPQTSPVSGWVVSNYLDNSLMLFASSGEPLGSLGVFGGQTTVRWQSAPGKPARPIDVDLAGDELTHFRKFATFIHGQSRAFFTELMNSIEGAHTYILPDSGQGDTPYAVLMGRPLALVRAGLRLELAGLPAFNTDLESVRASIAAGDAGTYDWTRRDTAGLLGMDFPVRLGDRNHLSDGLVAYLIDGPNPYDTLYAPASTQADGLGVRRPAPDTLLLKLRANIDPPATPYADAAAQAAALRDVTTPSIRTSVTLLMDPRASVHATTGILPVKAIDLPEEVYSRALQTIEVAFFTHPVLRGSQGLALPVPDEPGFLWQWTMGVKQGGAAQPYDEDLLDIKIGDRAHFSFSPQVAQDGWLKLVPQPPRPES